MVQKLVSERRRTLIIPLIIVLFSKTTSITARVSFCRPCFGRLVHEDDTRLEKTAMAAFFIAIALFMPLVVSIGPSTAGGAVVLAVLAGMIAVGAAFPVHYLLRYLYERKVRPTCPVCGRDAMRLISRNFSNSGIENGVLPDVIDCTCGYRGPRAPLDGLWVFVETNGPGPLAGSPVEKMANASRIARDARK